MKEKESAVVQIKDNVLVGEILQKCLKGASVGNNITEMIKKSLLTGVEAKI